jgi:hypothetical protein
MLANVTAFVTWVTREVINTPEPLALLVLGVLFLALSFAGRPKRVGEPAPHPVPPPSRRAAPESGLAPQESH